MGNLALISCLYKIDRYKHSIKEVWCIFLNQSNQFPAPKKELIIAIANYITAYKSNVTLELTLEAYKTLLKIN